MAMTRENVVQELNLIQEHCERSGCSASPLPLCGLCCVHCGYDLRGSLDSKRCPECGVACDWLEARSPPEPPAAAAVWRRLWLPFAGPEPMLWFVRPSSSPTVCRRRNLGLALLAVLSLASAGYALSWKVHQVEWVFSSDVPFEPNVKVHPDSTESLYPPTLLSKGKQIPGRFSFGARDGRFRFGSYGSASGGDASPGTRPIYWDTRNMFGSGLIAPNLTELRHFRNKVWEPPTVIDALVSIGFWVSLALSVCFVNLYCLPRLLLRINRDGSGCKTSFRQGFQIMNQAACLGLIMIGALWVIGSLNPANWLADVPGLTMQVARVLLALGILGPAWVAARGIGFDRARRLFPRRALSATLAVLCHLGIQVGLVGLCASLDLAI